MNSSEKLLALKGVSTSMTTTVEFRLFVKSTYIEAWDYLELDKLRGANPDTLLALCLSYEKIKENK